MNQTYNNNPKYLNAEELSKILKKEKLTCVVEICKKAPQIFKKGIWVGHRMGGMSTWLTSALYQLPFKYFYVYVDKSECHDQETLKYFDSFYKRVFYKNYLGLCNGQRN